MLRPNGSKGFSITEVVVASLILTIAALGVFTGISYLRKPAQDYNPKVNAALYGYGVLQKLKEAVDAGNFDTADLSVGAHSVSSGPYTADYIVENVLGGKARKVTMTVSW